VWRGTVIGLLPWHAVEERVPSGIDCIDKDTESVLAGSHAYGPGNKERDVRRKRRK